MGKRSEQIFFKGDIEVDNRYMKRYQTPFTEQEYTHRKTTHTC